MTATIGFNHLFIEQGSLTGPGYYAVQLVENILSLPPETLAPFNFKLFVQQGTEHHYSATARDLMMQVPALSGRFSRVMWEQTLLPLRSRREKIDLLFSPGFVSPAFGAPLKAAMIHDMYYRVLPHTEPYQRQYWRVMIPVTSRVCDLILANSECSRRDIEHYLPAARGKTVVTPLASRFAPVDEDRPDRGRPDDPPFVLMVANLTPNKNVTRLVEALATLRRQGRRIDLVHIGADHLSELARAIAAHRMESQVRALGKVDDATLMATARDCLCMVVPSLYEGFGMPALEAQALGAPLICSDRGALPEVAGDAALMFDPEDPQALAGCIARVADDPALRAEMRRRGLNNVRNFSWRRTAELTLAAFDQQLRRRGLVGGARP